MPPLRILVVDNRRVLVDELTIRLDAEPDLLVYATLPSVRAAKTAIAALDPNVAIVHVGFEADRVVGLIEWLRDEHPRCPVVIVGEGQDSDSVVAALRAGADAFVQQERLAFELVPVVRNVAVGAGERTGDRPARALPGAEARRLLERLTRREREVLEQLVA